MTEWDPFVVHEHDDWVFTLLRDMCLPPNLVTTPAHYPSDVKKKKKKNDLSSFPRQIFQYHSNSSLCPNHSYQRSWSWSVLWWPRRPPRTNTKKSLLFIIGDWSAKVGRQEIPGATGKFGLGIQNAVGQRLTEFCRENIPVIANTLFQQHKTTLHMDITKWSIPESDWLYSL